MMEDVSFDPLTDKGGPLDPDVAAESEDAESRAYAALFDHAGVTDPEDWRSVALNLACRYNPDLLMGEKPCASVKPARKGGRPQKWDNLALHSLLLIIAEIQAAASEGRISRNLSTSASACDFFANDPLAASYRDRAWMIPKGVTAETLQNKLSSARKEQAGHRKRITETS